MSKPHFCVNCKYYRQANFEICDHPESTKYDLVTGHTSQTFCYKMREDSMLGCGKSGIFFEPKKKKTNQKKSNKVVKKSKQIKKKR